MAPGALMARDNGHPMNLRGLAILILLLAPWSAQAAPRFNTERVDGRNYVTLRDFINFYGFNRKWVRNLQTITLKKKYVTLRLKLDSSEALLHRENQDVRLHLSFPPIMDDNLILIPELDVIKTFDPVLRPWAVPEFKVRTIMIDAGHGGFDGPGGDPVLDLSGRRKDLEPAGGKIQDRLFNYRQE